MPELSIPLDPCNPGQFYACCGLIELFELSGVQTLSKFNVNWRHPREAVFTLDGAAEDDLASIAKALKQATYTPLSRPDAEGKTPEADSIAPVQVTIFNHEIVLDWWLEWFYEKARQLKCWAGQVTTQKLFSVLPSLLAEKEFSFDAGVATTTRFGIDPRSAWVALNLGYSPNEQGQESRTYPVVEMLAAFGLQGFRPSGDRSQGFSYHLWLSPLPRVVARTVCAKPWSGGESSAYRFSLGERGSYKYFTFAEPVTFSLGDRFL